MKTEIKMYKQRETKGTVVYSAIEKKSLIETLYLKKEELPDDRPNRIVVTVESESE